MELQAGSLPYIESAKCILASLGEAFTMSLLTVVKESRNCLRADGGGRCRQSVSGDATAKMTFFGVDPKKVPPFCFAPGPCSRASRPPHPRPLSRKGREENDLGESAAMVNFILSASRLGSRPTFFASTPKKSPFFSAPKKPKKSALSSVQSHWRTERVPGRPVPPDLELCFDRAAALEVLGDQRAEHGPDQAGRPTGEHVREVMHAQVHAAQSNQAGQQEGD
jgi:hypothetical protein